MSKSQKWNELSWDVVGFYSLGDLAKKTLSLVTLSLENHKMPILEYKDWQSPSQTHYLSLPRLCIGLNFQVDYQNGINGNCSRTASNPESKLHMEGMKARLRKFHMNDCYYEDCWRQTLGSIVVCLSVFFKKIDFPTVKLLLNNTILHLYCQNDMLPSGCFCNWNVLAVLEEPLIETEMEAERGAKYSIWVSFCEIYNECVYDLLLPISNDKRRKLLRLAQDVKGCSYVKGNEYLGCWQPQFQ